MSVVEQLTIGCNCSPYAPLAHSECILHAVGAEVHSSCSWGRSAINADLSRDWTIIRGRCSGRLNAAVARTASVFHLRRRGPLIAAGRGKVRETTMKHLDDSCVYLQEQSDDVPTVNS
ncbi:hypothetical protein J6590_002064 [Homalodisca vitripennis]|nr:hypothetical protein J6590_002064 [Homalodisca vitripennis]